MRPAFRPLGFAALLLLAAVLPVHAQEGQAEERAAEHEEGCAAAWANVRRAEQALSECLRSGGPCNAERAILDEARAAARDCGDRPPPDRADPTDRDTATGAGQPEPIATPPLPATKPAPVHPFVNVNAFFGSKRMDGPAWGPLDQQGDLGVEVSVGPAGWPVVGAMDMYFSSDRSSDSFTRTEGSSLEIGPGVRAFVGSGLFHGYVGAGGMAAEGRLRAVQQGFVVAESSSWGFGWWAGAGAFVRLGGNINVGVAARHSSASARFSGRNVEVGGTHVGVILGFAAGSAASPSSED